MIILRYIMTINKQIGICRVVWYIKTAKDKTKNRANSVYKGAVAFRRRSHNLVLVGVKKYTGEPKHD